MPSLCHTPEPSQPVFDGGYGIPYQEELPVFDGGYGIPYQQELPVFDGGGEMPSILDPVRSLFESAWGALWGGDSEGAAAGTASGGTTAGGNNAPNSGSSRGGRMGLDWLFEDLPQTSHPPKQVYIPPTGGV